jgi:hypothetical protein
MRDVHKITEVSILTRSTEPLTGIVQVNTADAEMKFEITEDLAHRICTDLERFLTRGRFENSMSDPAGIIILDNGRKN